MKTPQKKQLKSVSFLIISLLFHLLLFVVSYTYDQVSKPWEVVKIEKPKEEAITFVDINDIDLLKRQGSIVEQEDVKKKTEKPKDDAKYLSQQNQVVEKETRAAQHGDFQNKQSNKSQQPPPSGAQASAAMVTPSASPKDNDELKTYENGDMVVKKQDKPKKAKTFNDLRPNSMAQISQQASESSVSQTNDYLKDVAISAETNLNTREFLYYSYFNRIKKKLRQHWEPMVHAKVRQLVMHGRQPASTGSKTTRCVITLDDQGTLTRVQVLTTSGLEDLDDAALEALKAAAPFPNPPQDLITDGLVRINWDFILET